MFLTSFRKLFFVGALHRRSNFANFCLCTQSFILVISFLVKKNANYAEICRVGRQIFNNFRLFNFSEIFTILL